MKCEQQELQTVVLGSPGFLWALIGEWKRSGKVLSPEVIARNKGTYEALWKSSQESGIPMWRGAHTSSSQRTHVATNITAPQSEGQTSLVPTSHPQISLPSLPPTSLVAPMSLPPITTAEAGQFTTSRVTPPSPTPAPAGQGMSRQMLSERVAQQTANKATASRQVKDVSPARLAKTRAAKTKPGKSDTASDDAMDVSPVRSKPASTTTGVAPLRKKGAPSQKANAPTASPEAMDVSPVRQHRPLTSRRVQSVGTDDNDEYIGEDDDDEEEDDDHVGQEVPRRIMVKKEEGKSDGEGPVRRGRSRQREFRRSSVVRETRCERCERLDNDCYDQASKTAGACFDCSRMRTRCVTNGYSAKEIRQASKKRGSRRPSTQRQGRKRPAAKRPTSPASVSPVRYTSKQKGKQRGKSNRTCLNGRLF